MKQVTLWLIAATLLSAGIAAVSVYAFWEKKAAAKHYKSLYENCNSTVETHQRAVARCEGECQTRVADAVASAKAATVGKKLVAKKGANVTIIQKP